MAIRNMGSATMRFNEGIIVSGSTDAALSVYHNQSNSYATTIDNDQSSQGHVLKLSTDGNGSNTRVLEMEDGDGDIIFRARADGRFGFGPDGVDSMGAGTFVVGIDNSSHTSDIAVSKRIQHLGDGDTYIDFEPDTITLTAGGRSFIKLEEANQDKMIINHGTLDIDLKVGSVNQANLIRTDAAIDSVYFGGADPSGVDNNFWVSGSINSQGTSDRGTAVFGGDVTISGSLHDGHGRHIAANELVASREQWTVNHDSSPSGDGSLLYLTPSYMPGMAQFMTAESNATSWTDYTGASWVSVNYNSDPSAMGGMQVYYDHDAADDDKKLMVNTAAMGGMSFTIPTSSGRLLNVVHNANASTVGVPLYFDMQAASPRTRVIADLPGDAHSSMYTDKETAWLFKVPHG